MGRFVVGVLIGVAVVVGGVVAYQGVQRANSEANAAKAKDATGAGSPGQVKGGRGAPSGSTTKPSSPGVTPLGLMARARAAHSDGDRLAAYERVVRQFPRSAEGREARAEAQRIRGVLARTYRAGGDAYRLRNVLSAMLWKGLPEDREAEIKREIVRLNEALIFSRRPSSDGGAYVIKPREALGNIARRYKVTPELLGRINRIKNLGRIRFGDTLKVVNGPFDILVEQRKYRLTVLLRGHFVKEYRIGIGKDETTPLGRFVVKDKLEDPAWYGPDGEFAAAGDPQNPLGERWIGITGGRGYGIHGTIEPETIGTACTRGCVRLLEEDVKELFDFIVPKHSRVTIVQ